MEMHGYVLDESKWETKGGNGQCNIATKKGENFFIKRLPWPKYPDSDKFKGTFRKQKIETCEKWYEQRKAIIKAIPGSGTGTIIKPIEYFREGPCYYEVSHWIDITSIPYNQIWKLSKEDKTRVMLTAAMSLADLHKIGIVHGDLDPGNILISRTASGNVVTKLIDFTDSFFENDPPETIMSKDFWWSPEVALYSKAASMGKSPNPYKDYITCKADVFSLGIVFHQYCARDGIAPICTKSQPWLEFQTGNKPRIDSSVDPEFKDLISSMLEVEPDNRPTMAEVHKNLLQILQGRISTSGSPKPKEKITPFIPRREEKKTTTEASSSIQPGPKKRLNGSTVVSANISSRNSRKVELKFSDGKEQIMDLALAIRQGYVIQV